MGPSGTVEYLDDPVALLGQLLSMRSKLSGIKVTTYQLLDLDELLLQSGDGVQLEA